MTKISSLGRENKVLDQERETLWTAGGFADFHNKSHRVQSKVETSWLNFHVMYLFIDSEH